MNFGLIDNEETVELISHSASGITKQVAEKLAKVSSADIFVVLPEKPYTDPAGRHHWK